MRRRHTSCSSVTSSIMRIPQPTRASTHPWLMGRTLTRWVAGILMLAMVLAGTSPCLCVGEPLRGASDRHACCAHSKTDTTRGSTANAALTASSQPCAGSRGTLAVEVTPNGGDQLRLSSLAVVTAVDMSLAPEVPARQRAIGTAPRHAPPPLRGILRI